MLVYLLVCALQKVAKKKKKKMVNQIRKDLFAPSIPSTRRWFSFFYASRVSILSHHTHIISCYIHTHHTNTHPHTHRLIKVIHSLHLCINCLVLLNSLIANLSFKQFLSTVKSINVALLVHSPIPAILTLFTSLLPS